jgi:hypothetical protein
VWRDPPDPGAIVRRRYDADDGRTVGKIVGGRERRKDGVAPPENRLRKILVVGEPSLLDVDHPDAVSHRARNSPRVPRIDPAWRRREVSLGR